MRKSTAPDQQCGFWQAENLPPPKQLHVSSSFRNRVCGFESSLTAGCVEVLSTAQPGCLDSDITLQRLGAGAALR